MPLSSTPLRLALSALIALCLCLFLGTLLAPLHAQTQSQSQTQTQTHTQPQAQTQAAADAPAPGLKRQRLALVLGIGRIGARPVLESARPDSEAVAAALRWGGFDVLLLLDPSAADLRASLKDFRDRLHADGIGLIYFTGLAAQVDARNLLLPADMTLNDALTAPALATVLRAVGVPLQELLDALAGGANSPRLLLVDAAYRNPTLARLTPQGLARLRLPTGTMALLGHAPGALQDPPAVTPQPNPPPNPQSNPPPNPQSNPVPNAPRELAASRFARVVVDALTTPRISVPEALRAVRLAVADSSGGLAQPWLAGDTFGREYLADATLLEAPVAPAAAATPVAPPDADRRATDGRTAQAPGRGERPVYQARISSFGHAEGDILTY